MFPEVGKRFLIQRKSRERLQQYFAIVQITRLYEDGYANFHIIEQTEWKRKLHQIRQNPKAYHWIQEVQNETLKDFEELFI